MNCFDRARRAAIAVFFVSVSLANSAEPIEVVPPGYFKRDLCLLPDGSGAVFAEAVSAANLTLKQVRFADKSVSAFQKSGREIAFSADGSVVAWTQGDGLGCSVEIDDRKRGSKFAIRGDYGTAPAISPDGRHVVFVASFGVLLAVDLGAAEAKANKRKGNEVEIKTDSKGNLQLPPGVRRLTSEGVRGDYAPSFSPDGKSIVFASRRDDDFEIYLMHLDGTGLVRLTNSPGIDNQPVFSPDGKRIAFTSNRDLNYEIYVMNADGSNPQRVTNHPERDDYPCWSKDGKDLLLIREQAGKFGVYRITAP
jgi:dipeptidyl aminopeptidase/acylaminoacyl peptidase